MITPSNLHHPVGSYKKDYHITSIARNIYDIIKTIKILVLQLLALLTAIKKRYISMSENFKNHSKLAKLDQVK